ncbi:hypothetical protein BaRGS_00003406 [Batillaria attramentaria]|uniref:Neurotransmitter-gated ion-channel transmembrane domain-containing protein n=1 Tax=Batillaria attramentaria TaxID=370345 RepID=A0ABD0M0D8_9CAEN
MNTLVFLVPLQSGEKVSFLVTICVSTSVFVSYFTTVMPRGLDSVPNTLKLLIGVIVESLIVLLATIVVLRLFHQQQQPNVPDPGKPGTQEAPQDLTHYPYDEQVCSILFYSFLEEFEWAAIESSRAFSQAIANTLELSSEWEMVNTSVHLIIYGEDDELSPKISLHLRRKTTFYTVCLVLPMVLTSYMNTLVFLVPLQSGEKVSFLVTIFVSTSVFVSYFITVMPRGLDSVPSTMKLFIGVIVESLIVLLATIVIMRLFHQQQQPNVPDPGKPGTQEAPQGPDGAILPGTRRQILNVKAERLDRVFFVLAFVGNTVFLAVLLYQSLSSKKTV